MRLSSTLPFFLLLTIPALSRVVINLNLDSQELVSAAMLELPPKGDVMPTSSKMDSEEAILSALEHSPEISPFTTMVTSDCGDGSILKWDNVTTDPYPPPSSGKVTISLAGTLSDSIEAGAYVDLTVKLGLIRLLSKQFDLCEEENISCPIAKGPVVLQDTWDLGRGVPKAKFKIIARAYTSNDEDLFCVEGTVDYYSN